MTSIENKILKILFVLISRLFVELPSRPESTGDITYDITKKPVINNAQKYKKNRDCLPNRHLKVQQKLAQCIPLW